VGLKIDRLKTAIAGERPDRPPVALWRHFPVDDQSPYDLARATLSFQRLFDFDFVKVTPASSYCLQDWGAQDAWRGATEGTRQYTRRVIHAPVDWEALPELDPRQGFLGMQLDCLRLLHSELGEETPLIQTIFSPLSQAKNLAGETRLIEHLHLAPQAVLKGLETITRVTEGFIREAMACGIDGIFYAVQHATYRHFDPDGYRRFGEPHDLALLEAASGGWLNVLHLHGEALIFELAEDYPVQVVNWHDRETAPGMAAARGQLSGKAVLGGLSREATLVLGSPDDVRAEARRSFEQAGLSGVMLGTGCVTPIHAPWANIWAAREIVDEL
jgi:uroporphyrinogen decarboxylase